MESKLEDKFPDDLIKKCIVSMVLPKLDNAAVAFLPYKKKDLRKIERTQRAAAKNDPFSKRLIIQRNSIKMNPQPKKRVLKYIVLYQH